MVDSGYERLGETGRGRSFSGGERAFGSSALVGLADTRSAAVGGTPEQMVLRKQRARSRGVSMGETVTDLALVALMAGWPTASARDWRDSGGMAETVTAFLEAALPLAP